MAHVPGGKEKIVFDRFHIMKHMNEAIDAVRKEENRLLMEDDFDILKGTKLPVAVRRGKRPGEKGGAVSAGFASRI